MTFYDPILMTVVFFLAVNGKKSQRPVLQTFYNCKSETKLCRQRIVSFLYIFYCIGSLECTFSGQPGAKSSTFKLDEIPETRATSQQFGFRWIE